MKKALLFTAAYALLIVLAMPVFPRFLFAGDPNLLIAAPPLDDAFHNQWHMWWLGYSLSHGLDYFHFDYQSYPVGGNLWLTMGNFVIMFMFYPLYLLVGLVAFQNAAGFIVLLLNCLAGFLLLRDLVSDRGIALTGGFMIGVNSYLLREMAGGRYEQAAIFWIVLFLWSFFRLVRTGRKRYLWLSSVLFALTAMSMWHYGIILSLSMLLWLALTSFRRNWRSLRLPIISLALGFVLLLPVSAVFVHELVKGYQGTFTNLDFGGEYASYIKIMNITSVRPGRGFLPGREWVDIKIPIHLLIVIPVVMIWAARKKIYDNYWNVIWLFSFVLCLGPVLDLGSDRLYLPFYYFVKYVPFMGRFLWPYRFLLLFFVSGAVILCAGLDRCALLFKTPWVRKFIPIMLVAMAAADIYFFFYLPVPSLVQDVTVPRIYHELAAMPDGVAMELPFALSPLGLLGQTVHQKKLFNPAMGFPIEMNPPAERDFLRRFDLSPDGIVMRGTDDLEYLKNRGLKYIVFNREYALRLCKGNVVACMAIREKLKHLLGEPALSYPEDGLYLYRL